jgi:hypothetical protein
VKRLFDLLDTWIVPGLLVATYIILIGTSDMPPWVAVMTLVMLGGVVALWLAFRELRLQAALSRLAAIGEPDELLALVERALGARMFERGKVALHVYAGIAHRLKGDDAAAERALDQAELARLPAGSRRTWTVIAGAQRVALAARAGNAADARAIYDADVAPVRAPGTAGPGALAVADEALAWVLVAEGKRAEARPLAEKLSKDVRLGAATRATAKHLLGRCAEPDDAAAAQAAYAEAAALAPRTWLAAR